MMKSRITELAIPQSGACPAGADLHRAVLESLDQVLVVHRASDGRVCYVTPSVRAVLGVTEDEIDGDLECYLHRVHEHDRESVRDAVRETRAGRAPRDSDFRIVDADGGVRWIQRQSRVLDRDSERFIVTTLSDVSSRCRAHDELAEVADRLREQALRDPLTGLWNRRGLEEMLRRERHRVRRVGGRLTAVFIDLDDFKSINDRFGHTGGDRALREASTAIERAVRPTDPVGRIGGDEFLAILPGVSVGEASQIAERIRLSVERSTKRFCGSASLGVSLITDDQPNVESVLSQTQSLLRRSKRGGKNRVALGCAG